MPLKNYIVMAFASAVLAGCGMSEKEQKAAAVEIENGRVHLRKVDEAFLKENGFQIVGVLSRTGGIYDGWGHEYGYGWQTEDIKYSLKKIPDNGMTYTMRIAHTGGEVDYSYDLQCVEKTLSPR